MTFDDGDAVYAMLMLAPPLAEAISPQPREVVFVVDTSGSMDGTSISQAKAALRQGLGYLGQDDRFNLIHFNSDSHLLVSRIGAALHQLPAGSRIIHRQPGCQRRHQHGAGAGHALNLPPQAGLMRQSRLYH